MMVNWLPDRIFKENVSHQQKASFYHYQWLSGKQIHCFTPPIKLLTSENRVGPLYFYLCKAS